MVRRGGLWGDASKTSTCPLLARVPAIAKTGNSYDDSEREVKRNAYLEIISTLWAEPEHVLVVNSYLQGRRENATASNDTEKFSSTFILHKLDDAWIASFLANNSRMTTSALERAQTYDSESLRQILVYALKAHPSLKLPTECIYKAVAEGCLQTRANNAGNRLGNWPDNAIDRHGKIDWGRCGVYKLAFLENGRATSITHMPTEEVHTFEEHEVILRTFALSENWADDKALISLGATKYKCADCFIAGCGPHKLSTWSARCAEFCNLARLTFEAHDRKRTDIKAKTQETKGFMKDEKDQRQKLAAKRTRDALTLKKQEDRKRRKVTFSVT